MHCILGLAAVQFLMHLRTGLHPYCTLRKTQTLALSGMCGIYYWHHSDLLTPLTPHPFGFPINHAGKNKRRSLQQLLEQESPRRIRIPCDPQRGFGFNLRGTTDSGGESRGQYIRSVDFSGNAHQWGLKAGDRILAVNSIVCENESHESVLKLIQGAPEQIELLVVADTQMGRHAMKATQSMLAGERKSAIHPETGM